MRKFTTALLIGLIALPGVAGPGSKSKKPAKSSLKRAAAQRTRSIANLLRTRRISVKMEKWSLDQLVKYLRAATGINIVVKKAAIDKDGGDVDAIEVSLTVNNVRISDVLALTLEQHDLGFLIKGNVLLITSKKDARGKPVLKIYSVAHLLVPIRDFPAPDINIYPSSYEQPEPPEPEINQTYESSDELAELVRNFTGKDTWENEGVNLTVFRKHLFIRTYPSVHCEIARFLAMLPH